MSAEVIDFPPQGDERTEATGTRIEVRAGELPLLVNKAEAALLSPGSGGGAIYQRGGQLVRILRLDTETVQQGVKRAPGSVVIHPLSREYLVLALSRAASWVRYDMRARAYRSIDPPASVAGALISAVGEWSFPLLRGLTAAPTLRSDGTLLAAPGYDPVSGLYAAFEPSDFPSINPKPTREDARAALAVLDDLFSECAFSEWNPENNDSSEIAADKSAHASVAIATTITAVVRHALATAPATGISARKAGSGKTTLGRAIAHVVTGREPPVLALSDDETEFRKCLLGILMAGDACILIDNVAKPVDSAALCAMLTNATYSDRVLGINTRVSVPTSSTWLLTGNHLEFVGDLTSRVLLSVLDREVEHPETYPFKRDLTGHVAEHRGELLAAALAVPLAYIAAGSPDIDAPRSRFADWDRLVRRPLLWLGCADPLATQEDLRAADPVREGLIAVLQSWHSQFGEHPASVADAIKAATAPGQSANEPLREALQAVAGERDGSTNPRRLGRYLVRNLRRIEDGKRLEEAAADPVSKNRRFRVSGVSGVSGVSANPTREKAASSSNRSGTNTDNTGNTVAGKAP